MSPSDEHITENRRYGNGDAPNWVPPGEDAERFGTPRSWARQSPTEQAWILSLPAN